jgi:SAM-dependent methyltransferase/uncharacterized protein YbaR (Trm112 family)
VRDALVALLRCPSCAAERTLQLDVAQRDAREIVAGALACTACGHRAPIERGVVDLMPDPPEEVRLEAAGLERFAALMRSEGWDRERILRLPKDPLGYWRYLDAAMEHMLAELDPPAGATLLDVGSNTCWAANAFAQRGLEVVALDIATVELQGLHTAEWFFEANDVYFERILATMTDPPIASGTLDYVFCSQVLHHNAKPQLRGTLRELHRVLKPGGTLIVLGEPLRFLTNLKRDHGAEVAEYEGNENIYFYGQYLRAARAAGFEIEVIPPRLPAYLGYQLTLTLESSALGSAKVFAQHMLRRSQLGRKLMLGFAMHFGPDAALAMYARKPA